MINRRELIVAAGVAGAMPHSLFAQEAGLQDFDAAFAAARSDSDLLMATREEREGLADEYDYYRTRTTAPRVTPSSRAISSRARDLLILFEVTGRARYEAFYRSPVWPKGQSGVTIAIGYDVGYALPSWLEEDWANILPVATIARLKPACGKSGQAANALIPGLRDLTIDWDSAERQFRTVAVPRWTAVTLTNLPHAEELSDDSLGALVSLVYNRGPSFKKLGSRYRHMREIRRLMVNREFAAIPDQILAMKELWPANGPVAGLRTRRDLEAKLFRAGLKA